MKEKILITGYNGALAQRLSFFLNKKYIIVFLSSSKKSVNKQDVFYWNINEGYIDQEALAGCSYIIHLSGYNIINRWSRSNKEKMHTSRIDAANLLFEKCKKMNLQIKSFISASAMGYYGLGLEQDVDENFPAGKDWLAKLVVDWESAANKFSELGARVISLRISLMMDLNSGFLKVTLLPMKFGVTSVFMPSNLSYSWIHIDDLANFIVYSIENNNVSGPYNMASPIKQTQHEVIKEIRKCVSPYAIIFPIPIFIMKIILGGRSQLIKGGLYLKIDKLLKSGFKFKHPTISSFLSKN
tara:strand:- start:29 stop:922 length:894 start_codon:yes stop_codon:yes gene_type:complete